MNLHVNRNLALENAADVRQWPGAPLETTRARNSPPNSSRPARACSI